MSFVDFKMHNKNEITKLSRFEAIANIVKFWQFYLENEGHGHSRLGYSLIDKQHLSTCNCMLRTRNDGILLASTNGKIQCAKFERYSQ